MDEQQSPVTLEATEPQTVVDSKTVRYVAIFLGAIAAYCIVGSSLGKFVPDFGEQSKQLISGGIGFLTGLVAPALASAFKK